MSLYTDLISAGIECSNHSSDLYFPATDDAKAILKRYPNIYFTTFRHNVHKTTWYEVPFGFEPFWQEAEAASKRIESTKSYEGVTE